MNGRLVSIARCGKWRVDGEAGQALIATDVAIGADKGVKSPPVHSCGERERYVLPARAGVPKFDAAVDAAPPRG
jgi:hypothetical protein